MTSQKFSNFREFWPYYVSQHQHPRNRMLHFIGTGLSFLCLALAATYERPELIGVAVLIGYSFAWAGHLFVEHNRPATWKSPLLSLLGDWRMFVLIMNGKMNQEIERLQASSKDLGDK